MSPAEKFQKQSFAKVCSREKNARRGHSRKFIPLTADVNIPYRLFISHLFRRLNFRHLSKSSSLLTDKILH